MFIFKFFKSDNEDLQSQYRELSNRYKQLLAIRQDLAIELELCRKENKQHLAKIEELSLAILALHEKYNER